MQRKYIKICRMYSAADSDINRSDKFSLCYENRIMDKGRQRKV